MKMRYIPYFLLSLYASTALGMDTFVIKDIRVEGIQRTEAGTVFSYLPVKVGETIDDEKATQAIKALYATGFFKDVRLEADNGVLIVQVQERPAVAQITFSGMKAFPADKVKEALKLTGMSEGMTFDQSMLDKAEQEIKRQYLSQGKYGAEVKTVVTPMERNRVAVAFNVEEGAVSKIRSINIVGNKAYNESELRDQFGLTTPGWLTWWTKDDQYSKQKLSADLEALRSFYMNQGYLEFNIDSTQVSITPDKRDIYITVNITEGEKYNVSDVNLAGELLVPEDELRQLITVEPGEMFNRGKLIESSKAIGDRLGNDGYAFANVNAVPEVDKEKHQVAFTFFVDPGRRVYVRRINLTGNTTTRDEVLRREMRQLESSWYSAEKINRSKERLNRTQYFSDVNVETPAVAGAPDQVDVNVNVTEKSTGSIMFGAGLSSSEGVVFGVTVSQNNLFGTGNRANLQINTGKVNTTYALSYIDPYFTPDGISRGFDIYKRDVDSSSLSVGSYGTHSYGLGVNFGIPLSEKNSINAGMTFDNTDLKLVTSSPQRYIDFCGNDSGCNYSSLRLDLGWVSDSRDSVLYPTKGTFQRLSGEVTVPGLDLQYYKVSYQYQWYKDMSKYFTLMLNGEVGYADGYAGEELPFFKNFYVGGVASVRGFETSSIGPHDPVDKNIALGGNKRFVGNAELFFPVPGMKDNKQLRLSAFFDTGAVYDVDEPVKLDGLRYSTGVGISWYSPFGPLKLVLAKALNAKDGDKTQIVQFQLGSQF